MLFDLLLFFFAFGSNKAISAEARGEYPPHLSFKQFRRILSFSSDDDTSFLNELETNENEEQTTTTTITTTIWDSLLSDALDSAEKKKAMRAAGSKNNIQNYEDTLFPFIACHSDMSEMHGSERYNVLESILSREHGDENDSKFFIKRFPIYNNNIKSKTSSDENDDTLYGTCFYSTIELILAKNIEEKEILLTPVAPFLKMRKNISGSLEDYDEESIVCIDKDTISLAVMLAPGFFSSHDNAVEFASNLQKLQDLNQNDPFFTDCDKKHYQRSSITVGFSDTSYYFFYEFQKQDLVAGITHLCHRLFLEHIVKKPRVISVEKVTKNTISNFHAKWIVESSEKEKNPFKDIGLSGNGEVIFVADTGLDLNHCYLKDYSEETMPLTTDFDLTGKINHNLRKVVQYVVLNDIGVDSDSQDLNGHGTHVVGTIVGKKLNGSGQETQGVGEGIASSAKVAFYDGNSGNSKSVSVNNLISQFFYFGKMAGARINSSSWNSGLFGEYDEKTRQVDEYFYNDSDDNMLMINSCGNDGETDTSTATVGTVKYPCVSKNALCIGASHNYKSDIDIDDIDVVAFFSSYGPTADGRIKPDLIAPGHQILSLEANSNKCGASQYDSAGNNDGLTFKSGTSMACPVAAGAAALVREYFANGYYPTGEKENEKMDITGSLLKAILINGAVELKRRSEGDSGDSYIESTFYDRYQGFGRIDLLNSLKLADELSSPDLYVENERVIEKGQTHEYIFKNVCINNEFRVTLAWRDPPSDSGCAECLVNDLDLEVLYDGKTYHPNGKTNEADRINNVERVIITTNDLTNPIGNMVHVKVKTANLGYGISQKYSLASTGGFDIDEVELIGSDSDSICGNDEFEYTIDIFTNRKPEETSWILKKQGSDKIIAAVIAGEYKEDVDRLQSFRYKGCITNGCYIFIIKDTAFDGLCCEKGMGSYSMRAYDEVLIESDSFVDRQKIEKFCHYGLLGGAEPTTSPTILPCNDDEFKYQIDIETDLNPDETRWILLRKPRIDGVDEGSYTESYREYTHEGCLYLGLCYSFFVYGDGECTIKANGFVVAERENFHGEKYEEFCYAGESSTSSSGIQTAVVGSNYFEKFDDVHSLWEYGKIVQIELCVYTSSSSIDSIGITYEDGHSFEHGKRNGDQHIITLGEDQYITKVSGRSSDHIHQLAFETNDGEVLGPYGYHVGDPFGFDFGANALVYIFGRASPIRIRQLGFVHASLPQTITDSPTAQPTAFPCGDNQFRYQIKIRTGQRSPEYTWWELDSIVDSVPFMTYRNQFESYSHTGCLTIDENYEFQMIDRRKDGLCCYFGSGSYKLSVDNNVVVRGNHFDDATHVVNYDDPDFVYNKHEFSYSSTLEPTYNPIEMTCGYDEFEYRIRVRTDYRPEDISWNFIYSDGDIIESVEEGEYFLKYYEHNHRGCLPLDECFEFYIEANYGGLCCDWGNGGYIIFVDDVVMAEGREWSGWSETKTFCYGPSYSQSPSSSPTDPLVCDENEFKYEVVVTTDYATWQTSWELNYTNGTIIDSVEKGEYTEEITEHLHRGCLEFDSCVIFTIYDSYGNGICCGFYGNGGYTILANDVVMAEGGEFFWEETKTFCYSHSFSPSTLSNQICENGSNNNYWCGYWASIGLCEDNHVKDWMKENCAQACSNCCMDYNEDCASDANLGRCTDTSQHPYSSHITWEEFMQASCRVSCDTCDLDFTPPPPPTSVICSDDQFKYEIVFTNHDSHYFFVWYLYYKYPDLIDGGYVDGIIIIEHFPPNYEKRSYGCASYSCFDLWVFSGYLKMYDKDEEILIAQNTETVEDLRFCHYAPEPTRLPTISALPSNTPVTPPLEAIFTISLTFFTLASDKNEYVSAVVERSIRKILFRAQIDEESVVLDVLDFSSCEEFTCDISVQICGGSCGEEEDPDFLAVVGNTMYEELGSGELLTIVKQTGHHMDVEIFDNLINDNPISIEIDFEYEAWPTSVPISATTLPSSTISIQDCNTPDVVMNLFGFITNIFQPINQAITNTTDPISDVLFGVESYNSIGITTCKDKMFELQIEIKTDGTPDKTSWELLYENGTIIDSIGQDTYSECDTIYNHSYCLDTSCFVFNMYDSFEFKGSYNITVGDTVLAYGDSFMWWKESKRFCYPQCDDEDNMFALQIELMTDDWPQETSWQLSFDNGTIVDKVDKRYYIQRNTFYNHRYCLHDGCYDVTFHDHIGDGMCCSYGKGSFKMKINDKVIREGGEFGDSVWKSFCHKTAETSEEDTITSFLFGIITDLFGDGSCCTTDTTGYPTPVPSYYPTTQLSFQPSILPSSNPSILPSSNPSVSSNPSILSSSNPSVSSNPSILPSSNPSVSSNPSMNPSSSYGVIRTARKGSSTYGSPFDDRHVPFEYGRITEIEVYADSYIHFIGIKYDSGHSFEHGWKYGTQHIIPLFRTQYITKVSGRSNDYNIYQIKFERNDGEIFGPYGFYYLWHTPFEFDFGENGLLYIFGRASSSSLYQLGFAHVLLPTLSPTVSNIPSMNPSSSYGVIRTARKGSSTYGSPFDDRHVPFTYGKITQIELYVDSSGYVRFFGIKYDTGHSFEHGTKQYGTQHIISLGRGQYITKISGRADSFIRQLKFEMNDDEVFGPYGTSYHGDPFEFDFEGNGLLYIFGRANSWRLYQLGFAHVPLPTLSPTVSNIPSILP